MIEFNPAQLTNIAQRLEALDDKDDDQILGSIWNEHADKYGLKNVDNNVTLSVADIVKELKSMGADALKNLASALGISLEKEVHATDDKSPEETTKEELKEMISSSIASKTAVFDDSNGVENKIFNDTISSTKILDKNGNPYATITAHGNENGYNTYWGVEKEDSIVYYNVQQQVVARKVNGKIYIIENRDQ